MNVRSKLLVVGNGMVGHRFLESLPTDSPFDVTVLGEEPRAAYDRVQLSAFFSGKRPPTRPANVIPSIGT